jgi:hypothetical protein
MKALFAATAVAALVASPVYAKALVDETPPSHTLTGHEVAAPPWSFACMTDHGPSPCGQPVWIYR